MRRKHNANALNVVYEEKEKRGFIKLNLVTLCFTLAAAAKGDAKLGFGFVAGLAIALWSANSGNEGDSRRNRRGFSVGNHIGSAVLHNRLHTALTRTRPVP